MKLLPPTGRVASSKIELRPSKGLLPFCLQVSLLMCAVLSLQGGCGGRGIRIDSQILAGKKYADLVQEIGKPHEEESRKGFTFGYWRYGSGMEGGRAAIADSSGTIVKVMGIVTGVDSPPIWAQLTRPDITTVIVPGAKYSEVVRRDWRSPAR